MNTSWKTKSMCCLKNESHLCSNRHGKIEDILKEEGTSCQILDDITIQFDTCERITNLVIQCILPAHENFTPKKFKHQNKYCLIFARIHSGQIDVWKMDHGKALFVVKKYCMFYSKNGIIANVMMCI